MPNKVINALIEERADAFVAAFRQRSKALFQDDTKRNHIRHPGEFGTYREAITADFIRCFLPQHLSVETGFIVNPSGAVSGQLDLIVYNPHMTPPLESKQRQRFFPVETVVAVGEVHSDISKTQFREALGRLAEVKRIRAALHAESSTVSRWIDVKGVPYSPDRVPFDQVFTFLVCNRFDFDFDGLSFPGILNEIYEDIDDNKRHNTILSIEDGLLLYSGKLPNDETTLDTYFPTAPMTGTPFCHKWILNDGNQYAPLKEFGANLFMHACHCTVAYADLGEYHEIGKHKFWKETE